MTEWPGGQVGGDTERKTSAVPEPLISSDGIYSCPRCSQGFPSRQGYLDHFVSAHTDQKIEKGYAVEQTAEP